MWIMEVVGASEERVWFQLQGFNCRLGLGATEVDVEG